MFGLSWDQIILIVLAALFLLGPERIPTAIKWLMDSLRKARTFAAGAQSDLRAQMGPELDELRRQIAELQSLKELKELRELRELDPRRIVGKSILGDEFSGGVKGFLGLTGDGPDAAASAAGGGAAAAQHPASAAPVADPQAEPIAPKASQQAEPAASVGDQQPATQPAAPSPWSDVT